MLVLTRKVNQTIVVGDGITITVVAVEKGRVRLGITAPKSVAVHRQEVAEEIAREVEEDEAYRQWWLKGGGK